TWSQTLANARRAAAGLQTLGVAQGDNVLSWLPNGPDALRVWFGANLLGAVYVPLNTAYRGRLLEHVVRTSGSRVMVAHAALADRLSDIDVSTLREVVVVRSDSPPAGGPLVWLPQVRLDGVSAAFKPTAQEIHH